MEVNHHFSHNSILLLFQDIQLLNYENQDEFQNKADEFAKLVKENEGVDISINAGQDAYQGSYVDIHNKIMSGFNTGDFPTIAVAYPDHVADYIAAESVPGKYVVNLAELATDEKIGFG